jgi:hypothetical protein
MKLTLARDGGTRGQRDAPKFILGLRLNCAEAAQRVWNRRDHSRARFASLTLRLRASVVNGCSVEVRGTFRAGLRNVSILVAGLRNVSILVKRGPSRTKLPNLHCSQIVSLAVTRRSLRGNKKGSGC